jgi:hypothetical protein
VASQKRLVFGVGEAEVSYFESGNDIFSAEP